jgi:DNA ligase D-like protein (predicted 3'-phosphoesterase)
VKRLAVQTEDHPLSYADFSGTIPEGEYGAGKVEIYDKGELIINKASTASISFQLKGKKLSGEFILIRFKGQQGSGKNWLFFKKK